MQAPNTLPFLIWLFIHIATAIKSQETSAQITSKRNIDFILRIFLQNFIRMNDEKVEFFLRRGSIDRQLLFIVAIQLMDYYVIARYIQVFRM